MSGQSIGSQIGYWEALEEERKKDRERKAAKVEKILNRARACRSFDGLERVGDDARSMGLWDAGDGVIRKTFGQCNARLRGRHHPVTYRKGELEVVVSDNIVKDMPWMTARDVSADGFLYCGPAE